MGELLQKQVDKLESRVGKLEVLETSGFVRLQPTYPGTADTGNGHVTGSLGADNDIIAGDDVIAGDAVTAVSMTASATVQGATVTSTGAVNAATAFNRAGIAMNNVIVLDKVCRVLDDNTSRATGFSNSAVQVTGATDIISGWVTLPSTLKAVWYSVVLVTAAATGVLMTVENPDFVNGATTLRGTTSQAVAAGNFGYSGGGVVSLSSLGRLRYVYTGTANVTRTIIDIWAYSV